MKKTPKETIGSLYDQKNNFFDVLRFLFASMVIFFHSYPLYYGKKGYSDPFAKLVFGQLTLGDIAVGSFLVISGFLITQSLLASNSYISYMIKRILRIFPAYLASTLLAALIIGPLITKLNVVDYFSRGVNSIYRFIFDAVTLNLFGYHGAIKDIFINNPYPSSINGSAWTLKHEFAMYLLLPLIIIVTSALSRLKRIDSKKTILLVLFVFLVLSILYYATGYKIPGVAGNKYLWAVGTEYSQFIKLGVLFFSGAALYLYKEKMLCNLITIIMAVMALLLATYFHVLVYAMLFIMPYLVVSIGVKIKFSKFKKYGDFSYGMYIYAFPVQQLIMLLFLNQITHFQYVILSFFATLLVSVLSWKLVESPCLNQKKKISQLLQNRVKIGRINKEVISIKAKAS